MRRAAPFSLRIPTVADAESARGGSRPRGRILARVVAARGGREANAAGSATGLGEHDGNERQRSAVETLARPGARFAEERR